MKFVFKTSVSVLALVMTNAVSYAEDEHKFELEEVVVTAQKRSQNISDVPLSIVLISAETIKRSGFEQVLDMQYSTPGFVQTGQENAGWVQLTMRGISTPTVTTGFSIGIGMFIDGVDQGMPYAFNQELVEVERIEVLRGPQSTLFGRNTIAGAFNITTKKPTEEFEVYTSVDAGNYDLLNVKASINGTLGKNFYGRLSLYSKNRDGFVKNVVTGGTVNNQNQDGGRLQLRWEPADNLTIDFSADVMVQDTNFAYHEIIADTPGGIDYTGEIPPGLFTISHNFDDSEKRDLWGSQMHVNYQMDNGYSFDSVSGYRYGRDDILEDTDHTSRDDQTYHSNKNFDQFTQEFRLSSPAGSDWDNNYDFVVGSYFLTQDANQVLGYEFGTESGLTPEKMFAPSSLQSLQLALFSHGNYYINDIVSINAGLRVDYERRKMNFSEEGFQLAFAFPSTPFFEDERSETHLSPAIGIDVKVSDEVLLYGKASISYKSGAFDLGIFKGIGENPSTPPDFSFPGEKVTAYEVGLKGGGLFDGRLNFGLSGYYMNYESLQIEIQVPALDPNLPPQRNRGAAAANIYGVEFEVLAMLFEGFTVNGGFAYTNAKFKDDVPVLGGNSLANSPAWTGYSNATYEVEFEDLGMAYVRGEWTYRGEWYSFATNNDFEKPGSFSLINARAGIQFDNGLEASVWGKNLADKQYCTELWDIIGGLRCGIGRPRTYGVSLSYRFN